MELGNSILNYGNPRTRTPLASRPGLPPLPRGAPGHSLHLWFTQAGYALRHAGGAAGYRSPHAQARPALRVGVGHGEKRVCAWGWALAGVGHAPRCIRTAGEQARWDVEHADAVLPSRRRLGYYGTYPVPGPRP